MRLALTTLAILLAAGVVENAGAVVIVDPPQGPVVLAAGAAGAAELSGLAYMGNDQYLAVGDSGAMIFELDVQIDAGTGAINSATVLGAVALAAGSDLEGLVYPPLGGRVIASDETGPAIREYQLSDGALIDTLSVPPVYAQIRNNFSLESLTQFIAPVPADDALFTANEEALTVDGPLATNLIGSTVRIQRFDANRDPAGQWAYVTDPYPGNPFLNAERSGVADLLALPSGELLVLERSFSTSLFRARLYEVDFAGATDTSALPALDGVAITPLGKTLLWERGGGFENFEGLALGRKLDGGDTSLLLVSDDGGSASQALYALRVVPEPSSPLLLGAGLCALALTQYRRALREDEVA